MKRKKICLWAAAFAAATIIGCGENSAYQQARRDLSQEAYEEALQGFETSIEEGDHVAESCRGAGIAQLKLGNYEEAIQYFEQAVSQGGLDRGCLMRPQHNTKTGSMIRRWIPVKVC